MQKDEKDEVIILDDEITPPVDGSKKDKEWDWSELKKSMQDKTISTDSGTWKQSRYIIGKRTPNDKQYCEKVDPLDIYSTTEIRKYITAVEVFLSKKENKRSINEQQGRMIKYVFYFGLGASVILWALYAGAISFPNI